MSPYLYRKDIIAEKDERLVNKVFTLKNAPFLCCSKCSADRMEDCSMETSRKCKIGCNSRFHCLPSCRADQCSIVLVSQNRWNQQQLAGCVLINHFVVEEHGMVLNVAPGLDEVVVVLAARVADWPGACMESEAAGSARLIICRYEATVITVSGSAGEAAPRLIVSTSPPMGYGPRLKILSSGLSRPSTWA